MKEELKKKMITAIGDSVIQTKESIAEKCVEVALKFHADQIKNLFTKGFMPPKCEHEWSFTGDPFDVSCYCKKCGECSL